MNKSWEITTYVLNTSSSNERQTADNLKEQLDSVIKEWRLNTNTKRLCITSDNASNIVKAISMSFYTLTHVRCFAHTINIAVQKALKVKSVNTCIGHIKRIVGFFARSPAAKGLLKEKQKQLEKPEHILINDVTTRWNSTVDMLDRFLEQKSVIYTALDELRNLDLLHSMEKIDSSMVSAVVELLNHFKTATIEMSSESKCTISLIIPLQISLLEKCEHLETDSGYIKEMKSILHDDLQPRYDAKTELKYLQEATMLDPRFKKIPNMTPEELNDVYSSIKTAMMERYLHSSSSQSNIPSADSGANANTDSDIQVLEHTKACEPATSSYSSSGKPSDASALDSLLGDEYKSVSVTSEVTLLDRVKLEVSSLFQM